MPFNAEMIVKNIKCVSKFFPRNPNNFEYKKCLDGNDYQKECDNITIRLNNHEMYTQRVQKSTLSSFDDKRCYESHIESKPLKYYY